MLTENHLAVIRAALMFWESPHDPAVAAPYLDQPNGSGDWIKETVAFLRQQLAACPLQYVVCTADGMSLTSHRIFPTLHDAQTTVGGSEIIATLIQLSSSPA